MKRALSTAAVLALGALALTACSSGARPAAGGDPNVPGITARATGTVTGTPDVATVVLGVQTQGPSAKGALDANSHQATALIDMLKSKGVAEADLQTSQLSISPSYEPTSGRITGYQVSNQVTATLHDIGSAGSVIDAAAAAAGDAVRVQQLSFSIDDDSALRAKARADAVKQAQDQAKQMAEAAGVRLGKLRSISESSSAPVRPLNRQAMDAAGSATPIQPGSQKLSISVEVAYDIDQ